MNSSTVPPDAAPALTVLRSQLASLESRRRNTRSFGSQLLLNERCKEIKAAIAALTNSSTITTEGALCPPPKTSVAECAHPDDSTLTVWEWVVESQSGKFIAGGYDDTEAGAKTQLAQWLAENPSAPSESASNSQAIAVSLPRLAVMPCPDYAGKHPFHDQRWIVTEGTEIERGHDPRPGQWSTLNGSLVAKMRDCPLGTAAAIVRACNSRAALVAALAETVARFDFIASSLAQGHTVSIVSVQNCAAQARTALKNAQG